MARSTILALSLILATCLASTSLVPSPTGITGVNNELFNNSKWRIDHNAEYRSEFVYGFVKGFVNGSIPLQFLRGLSSTDDPPFAPRGSNLDITLYDSDITGLTFNASGLGFEHLADDISRYFNRTVFARPVYCAYPLSGQYGQLPRILFYALLVFSLVARHHVWLSTAALGTAMTYSATAAIHAIAIFVIDRHESTTDVDIQGIFPVLVAGCIMLTPALNWSITVRQNAARPVVVLWGFLLFGAAIGCIFVRYSANPAMSSYENPSTAICQRDDSKFSCNADNYFFLHQATLHLANKTAYQECECFDLCGTIQFSRPLRRNTQLAAYLVKKKVATLISGSTSLANLAVLNFFSLIIVFLQGICSLIEAHVSQTAVRNWIYRKLTKGNLHDPFLIQVRKRRWRTSHRFEDSTNEKMTWGKTSIEGGKHSIRWFAKLVAAFAYLSSILLVFICPPLFVTSIVVNECEVRTYLSSEGDDAVGQWGSWVGAAFVLLAAIIIKYSPAAQGSVVSGYGKLILFKRRLSLFYIQRRVGEPSLVESKNGLLESQTQGIRSRKRKNPVWHDRTDSLRMWFKLKWFGTVEFVYEFLDWWQHPEIHSTWDWVIINDEYLQEEHGELYQSWDTRPEAIEGLVGPYYPYPNHRRQDAKRPERFRISNHDHLLQNVPRPIQRSHTGFNIFAAALNDVQDHIRRNRLDLLPNNRDRLAQWYKLSTTLLEPHESYDDYSLHHGHLKGLAPSPSTAKRLNISFAKAEQDSSSVTASQQHQTHPASTPRVSAPSTPLSGPTQSLIPLPSPKQRPHGLQRRSASSRAEAAAAAAARKRASVFSQETPSIPEHDPARSSVSTTPILSSSYFPIQLPLSNTTSPSITPPARMSPISAQSPLADERASPTLTLPRAQTMPQQSNHINVVVPDDHPHPSYPAPIRSQTTAATMPAPVPGSAEQDRSVTPPISIFNPQYGRRGSPGPPGGFV